MSVSRLVWRLIHERAKAREAQETTPQTATLLVGAGQNGLAIAKEALKHPSLGMNVRGFLDDDRTKTGMEVHGLRVIGTLEQVEIALQRSQAKQLIITTTAIPPKAILSLMDRCRSLGVKVRIVPALFEILGSKSQAEALREVQIEDLLSRDPISPSMSVADLRALYSGKRIMVTGAGGSIGAELCRQLALIEPEKLLLLERDENNLFEVHRELTRGRLDDLCVPILADITDTKEIDRVFREHRPQIVFHAAAFKHVPMMERFPAAAVRNNVFGTKNLVDASERRGVESFLMISTDKAVNPQSVMGATKRLAEIVVQSAAASSKARFACVRFGNVLGSRGSVVPIFRDQIARGGPVTVTHPEATRYFMTIPEAANLVLQAATKGKAGEIYLLDMGKPVRIIDLARQMIHLSGASEDVIPIQITGTRPGEKLFEELRADSEELSATTLRKVLRVKPQAFDAGAISEVLQRMDFAVRAQDHEGVRVVLRDLGIGYGVPSTATVAEPVPPRLPM
jgi:FlaA1/EpsC-like NDP-sugar epimerase